MVTRKCLNCKKSFDTSNNKKTYCSKICTYALVVKNHCLFCKKTFLSKRNTPRKYCSHSCSSKNGNFKKGKLHPKWKNIDVGYSGLHKWVRVNFGKHPPSCEECECIGKSNNGVWNIVWANLDDKYTRDRNTWRALCIKCHINMDFKKDRNRDKRTVLFNKQFYFKNELNKPRITGVS